MNKIGKATKFRPSTIAAPQEVYTSVNVFTKFYDDPIKSVSKSAPVRSYMERVSKYDKNIYH